MAPEVINHVTYVCDLCKLRFEVDACRDRDLEFIAAVREYQEKILSSHREKSPECLGGFDHFNCVKSTPDGFPELQVMDITSGSEE